MIEILCENDIQWSIRNDMGYESKDLKSCLKIFGFLTENWKEIHFSWKDSKQMLLKFRKKEWLCTTVKLVNIFSHESALVLFTQSGFTIKMMKWIYS